IPAQTPHPGSPVLQEEPVPPGAHVQVLAVGEDFSAALEVAEEDLALCRLPDRENMGKVIGRKEEEDWKSCGIWIWPLASCLSPMEELSASSWECLKTSLAPSLPPLSQVPDPLGADLSHILVACPWSPPATAIGKSHLSQAVVSPRCPQAQSQETKRFPRKSHIKSSSGPAFLLFSPHRSRTRWNKHIVQALK
uniref:Uncharacterized protein n=1 Tax=Corvus moneduloides TaxID=1196302 RepID=A0A8C3DZK4_CORMO